MRQRLTLPLPSIHPSSPFAIPFLFLLLSVSIFVSIFPLAPFFSFLAHTPSPPSSSCPFQSIFFFLTSLAAYPRGFSTLFSPRASLSLFFFPLLPYKVFSFLPLRRETTRHFSFLFLSSNTQKVRRGVRWQKSADIPATRTPILSQTTRDQLVFTVRFFLFTFLRLFLPRSKSLGLIRNLDASHLMTTITSNGYFAIDADQIRCQITRSLDLNQS